MREIWRRITDLTHLRAKSKILSMPCTCYNGTSSIFLILLISLLYCLPPQLEYELLEGKDLGLPIHASSLAPKTSSRHMTGAWSIFLEINEWASNKQLFFGFFKSAPGLVVFCVNRYPTRGGRISLKNNKSGPWYLKASLCHFLSVKCENCPTNWKPCEDTERAPIEHHSFKG